MAKLTFSRPDVSRDEVSDLLRKGLGPRYNVLPGMRAGWGFTPPRPDAPDAIAVGTGSNRVRRTQVRIDRRGSETQIRVSPPGPITLRLPNMLGINRKVHRVLAEATSLGSPRDA
jgi:hypothetical protein